jgi:UPF0176 protein
MHLEMDPAYQILLYYRYVAIDDPEAFAEQQRALCAQLDLRGRILIACEGMNGTVSGGLEETREYMETLQADLRFREMAFKVDAARDHVFPRLSIKVRSEVVTLGLEPEQDVNPLQVTGTKLQPYEWREMLEAGGDDLVVLDGRNAYEAALGHFKGALCPDIEHFRDFPGWFEEHRDELRGKRVMTYCTGGIRCEKLSGFLLEKGITEVFQLDGGIIRYGHDADTAGRHFDGRCYVFDERVVVDVNRTETNCVVSRCEVCGELSDRYVNCAWASCNRQHFRCAACEEREGRACTAECRAAIRCAG